jgi:hypothetical protein
MRYKPLYAWLGIRCIVSWYSLHTLPHDLADSGIVYVGDLREEVVLDLEIQAAYQPAYQFVTGGEVGGCFDLVRREFVGQFIGLDISQRKLGMFYRMRELEHDAQDTIPATRAHG